MKHKQSCDDHVRTRVGCDECLRLKRLYNKRRAALALQQRRLSAPASVTRQWLQQLRALGYSIRDLSQATGLAPASVWRLSSETQTVRVQLKTYRAIERAWRELHDFPAGGDGRAARAAAVNGWTPPAVDAPPPAVDTVAIDRALKGEPATLTPDEKAEALRVGVARGMLPFTVAKLLRMNGEMVNRYLAGGQPKQRGPKKAA